MKVKRILHSSVNVEGQLEDCRKFYGELLGLDTAPRPDMGGLAGHWYRAADAQVHLVDGPEFPEGINPTGHHVCFAVDDIEAALAELNAAGLEHFRSEGPPVQVWITDPAGNTVELQQEA